MVISWLLLRTHQLHEISMWALVKFVCQGILSYSNVKLGPYKLAKSFFFLVQLRFGDTFCYFTFGSPWPLLSFLC